MSRPLDHYAEIYTDLESATGTIAYYMTEHNGPMAGYSAREYAELGELFYRYGDKAYKITVEEIPISEFEELP